LPSRQYRRAVIIALVLALSNQQAQAVDVQAKTLVDRSRTAAAWMYGYPAWPVSAG
jgi:hypothetical protein